MAPWSWIRLRLWRRDGLKLLFDPPCRQPRPRRRRAGGKSPSVVGKHRKPEASTATALLAIFDAFFAASDVKVLPLTAGVCDRAALIRARYRYKLGDALNLAAAVEEGCDVFVTNDIRLSAYADIPIEILS